MAPLLCHAGLRVIQASAQLQALLCHHMQSPATLVCLTPASPPQSGCHEAGPKPGMTHPPSTQGPPNGLLAGCQWLGPWHGGHPSAAGQRPPDLVGPLQAPLATPHRRTCMAGHWAVYAQVWDTLAGSQARARTPSRAARPIQAWISYNSMPQAKTCSQLLITNLRALRRMHSQPGRQDPSLLQPR